MPSDVTLRCNWNVIGASVRGTAHEKTDLPCQDAHCFVRHGDVVIASVADGAGSSARAELGSMLAARESVETVVTLMSADRNIPTGGLQSIVQQGLVAARRRLEVTAEELALDLRDLATTLILFVASKEFVVGAQIGDGGTVALSESGELLSVTVPPMGEYVNETTFLVSNDWLSATQIATVHQSVQAICAFSDGLQLLALRWPGANPFDRFFRPLFAFAREGQSGSIASSQLETFLNSARLNERTDDDKTLLLAGLTY